MAQFLAIGRPESELDQLFVEYLFQYVEKHIINTSVKRLLIIPPNRGYAGQGLIDINTGAQVVPPGAVLVFEVTLDAVELPT